MKRMIAVGIAVGACLASLLLVWAHEPCPNQRAKTLVWERTCPPDCNGTFAYAIYCPGTNDCEPAQGYRCVQLHHQTGYVIAVTGNCTAPFGGIGPCGLEETGREIFTDYDRDCKDTEECKN